MEDINCLWIPYLHYKNIPNVVLFDWRERERVLQKAQNSKKNDIKKEIDEKIVVATRWLKMREWYNKARKSRKKMKQPFSWSTPYNCYKIMAIPECQGKAG